jgi:hypothetical protein
MKLMGKPSGPPEVGQTKPRSRTGSNLDAREWSQEERLADIHRMLDVLNARWPILERKVDALLRHAFVSERLVAPSHALSLRRFPHHSQHEEDGWLLGLFDHVGATNRYFVEIGCGVNGGNSGFLAAECGWRGLMVDEARRCIEAVIELFSLPGVQHVLWSVTPENVNTLVAQHQVPQEPDLVSLDIDSHDFWVWQALSARPRVMVVEYNSFFGPSVAVTVPPPATDALKAPRRPLEGVDRYYFGASLGAYAALGRQKGYRLVGIEPSGANAFFLRADVGPDIPEQPPADVFRYMRKHRRAARAVGDPVAYFESRGLPLVAADQQG